MRKWWKTALLTVLTALAVCPMALAAEENPSAEIMTAAADVSDQLFQCGSFSGPQTLPWETQLYDTQGTAYNVIYNAMSQSAASVDVSSFQFQVQQNAKGDYEAPELNRVYAQVLNDHPEFFYISGGFSFSHNYSYVSTLMIIYTDAQQYKQAFNEKVQAILNSVVGSNMNDLEKALALHDYLVLNCQYDYNVGNKLTNGPFTGKEPIFSAYGALIEGNAVCQGYAEAYQLLLKEEGIQAGIVSSDAMNHAWNWVIIDGKEYHVDVTWDDPMFYNGTAEALRDLPGQCVHNYFLRSAAGMKKPGATTPDHYNYSPGADFNNTDFETEHLFTNSNTAFFWHNNAMYYIDADGQVKWTNDQQLKGNPVVSAPITVREGNDLYF